MRKILEIWQEFQNRILSTVKENRIEKSVSNVLGVKIDDVGNPYKPETLNAARVIQKFKKGARRFSNPENYLIFQKNFLENILCSPFQTLRLQNITQEAKTFLPLGSGILEDMRVLDRLGYNAKYKSFKQVAKEQKLQWWSKAKIGWIILTVIGIALLWILSSKKDLSNIKEASDTVLFTLLIGGICSFGLWSSFSERSKKRKILLKDFLRAKNYPFLDNNNERRAIFHNGTDSRNNQSSAFEKDYGRNITCDFLDFKSVESPNFEKKKEVIKKAAELAIAMDGRVFYLLGDASECYYEFESRNYKYTFGFYITEIGIEVDDMVIFLKEWPATSTTIQNDVALGHVEKRFKEEGLNLFTLSPDL